MSVTFLVDEDGEDSSEASCLEEAFGNIELNFNQMVAEMEEDPKMAPYIDAYSNLFDFLYSEHVKTMDLLAAKSRLELEREEGERRLTESHNVIMDDVIIINDLKSNIERRHQDIDEAHAREQGAQEIIDNLRRTIITLETEIEFKNKMTEINTDENTSVTKHRQGLEREKVKLIQEVGKLNDKLDAALAYQEELERRTDFTDVQIHEISDKLNDTEAQVDKYHLNKEKLETELVDQHEELSRKTADVELISQFVANDKSAIAKLDADVKEQIEDIDKCIKTLESWNLKYCRMQLDYDVLTYKALTVKAENDTIFRNLDAEIEGMENFKADCIEVHRLKKILEEILEQAQKEIMASLKERNQLHDELVLTENKILDQKLQMDASKREIINQMREKDIIRRNIAMASRHNTQQSEVMKNIQANKTKVETEMITHVQNQAKQKKEIIYLDRERDRLTEEAEDNIKLMEELMEKTRTNKLNIFEIKKQLAEIKNKQRMQQNLFDACRSDRKALTKSYGHLTSQMSAQLDKLNESKMTINLYVGEVEVKGQEIVVNKATSKIAKDEIESWRKELKQCQRDIHVFKAENAQKKADLKSYHKSIEQSDQSIKASDKVIVALVNERDLLAAQLYRRNDELCLLYRKIKILEFTLDAGYKQYNRRLKDVHLMKLEIKHLRQEKLLLVTGISNMNDLQTEVFHLEVDLTRERVKSKMLEHELRYPSNIHRWRKVEASNPDVFRHLQKILLLQKKVLLQSKQISHMEIQLREGKKLYNNYRQMVSKQPGPELEQRLNHSMNKLETSCIQKKQLQRERSLLQEENVQCTRVLVAANLELRSERHKLAMAKQSRRNLEEKKRNLEEQGQQVFDKMRKLLTPRTIVTIGTKALRRPDSASSTSSI